MKKIPLKEKIKLTSGQNNWHFFESDALNGRKINVADGPHGVRVYGKKVEDGDFLGKQYLKPTTLFPSASAMASTWNKALIEEAGKTIGKECRHHQVDVLLGPGINLKRSPLGGRNFEYYSEDPYLTSKIAEGFIKGVQSEQVGACIKHFGLNEQETMRRWVNVNIDERTMHEMYLYPFYKTIQSVNPWMVMSSYNKLNGDYASESKVLLLDILRKQWGYDGAVVSDWGAVQDKVKSIKNGMNVEMPGPSSFEDDVLKAIDENRLTEAELDASFAPLFDLHEKVKAIKPLETIDLKAHHNVAKKVASEAIVLLENDGILPFNDDAQSVGVIGSFAKNPRINGGGSATVKPYHQEIPLEALKQEFSHLTYAEGYEEDHTDDSMIEEAVSVAKESDIVFFFTGTTDTIETEGKDREHLALPEGHIKLFKAISKVNKNLVVLLSNGSALDLRDIKKHSRAILETWFLGGAAADAIVDIITGKISPSGRLQETFPLSLKHTPHYGTFPPLKEVDYRQDLIMNGYRYYDTHDYEVLYPFGYGLSYATILYQGVHVDDTHLENTHKVMIDVTLENTSDIDAYETVQVYIGASVQALIKPEKELKAFKKVMVKAHSKKTVQLEVPLEAFESYSERVCGFVVYNGDYTIHVGRHSKEIYQTHALTIDHQEDYIPAITFDYPVEYLRLYYPKWFHYIEKHFRALWWHEKEEPIWRILDRYKRHKNISEDAMSNLIKKIKDDIHV